MNSQAQYTANINDLIHDIIAYVGWLNRSYSVSIHGIDQTLGDYLPRLLPINCHRHPLCQYIKTKNGIQHCQRCQRYVINHLKTSGECFGPCYFGMCCFAFPFVLDEDGKYLGFISVYGYHLAERCKPIQENAIARYQLDPERIALCNQASSQNIPEMSELRVLVRPLAYMLSQLSQTILHLKLQNINDSDAQGSFYRRIIQYLNFNYQERITMKKLAQDHHCSVSYLSHFFKEKSGMDLRTYINSLRIRDAAAYLINTNMSVTDIAFTIGFTDSNYFSTVFQREKGCSPTAYRKQFTSLDEDAPNKDSQSANPVIERQRQTDDNPPRPRLIME